MTRAQAQIALLDGKKISHKYFMDYEYVMLNGDKKLIDESGLILNKQDFWLSRHEHQFDNDWYVVSEDETI